MEVLQAIDFFMPFILLLFWYLFGMYSDTAINHGRWVAFLIPISPWLLLFQYLLLGFLYLFVYPFFILAGKKATYHHYILWVKNPGLWGVKPVTQDATPNSEEIDETDGKSGN